MSAGKGLVCWLSEFSHLLFFGAGFRTKGSHSMVGSDVLSEFAHVREDFRLVLKHEPSSLTFI